MSFPTVLTIGPYRYTVDKGVPKKKTVVGNHRSRKSQILVRKGMSPDNDADTLLHEALHGMFHATGLNTTVEAVDKDLEELIVKTLSPILLLFLRQNPGIVRYLQFPEL